MSVVPRCGDRTTLFDIRSLPPLLLAAILKSTVRELLLAAIVAVLSIYALMRPAVGILAYNWFALMRPDVLAWAYGDNQFSLILAVCTLVGSLRYMHQFGVIFHNRICLIVYILEIPLFISVTGALDQPDAWGKYQFYLRVVFMTLLIPALITTRQLLRQLLIVMGLSLGALGLKFGLFGVIHGGVRFAAGYGGMLSDNNDLALALCMCLPLVWYLRPALPRKWMRTGALAIFFFTIAGIVMTYSRGGALTAGCILILVSLRSRRKIAMLVLLAVMAAPAVYLVHDSYLDRLSTIATPNHEASSYSRMALGKAALKMWADHPWFGVGFGGGSFTQVVGNYTDVTSGSVAHNTYAQVLADSGGIAFVLYVGLLWGTIIWLGRVSRRLRTQDTEMWTYAIAIQTSLLAFAFGSVFLSRVHFDFLYMLLMSAAALMEILRTERYSMAGEPGGLDPDTTTDETEEIQPNVADSAFSSKYRESGPHAVEGWVTSPPAC